MKQFLSLLVLAGMLMALDGCGFPPDPNATLPYFAHPTTPGAVTVPAQPETTPLLPESAPTEPAMPPASTPEATTAPPDAASAEYQALQYEDMKAIWLSQYDLLTLYVDGEYQRDSEEFTRYMAQVLDNVVSQGFNTVFLQVRPNADSMYPSQYYPMSAYVVGKLGISASYDPLPIIIDLAHARSLSIHAWINPMRAMADEDIHRVSSKYPMGQWYRNDELREKYLVLFDGKWYLNPAYEEVQDLIVAGAREIMDRYAFDGLHMDDYFYPTPSDAFDLEAYRAFGNGRSLREFRRDNINLLVQRLYTVAHSSGAGRIFGISPAGNVEYVYNTQCADVYTWCKNEGYIDYICPQVYFGLEHQTHGFVEVCNTFSDIIHTDSVDLIIGMTFGKALSKEDPYSGSGKYEWEEHSDVLARCLETTRNLEHCRGVSVFCYQYLFRPLAGTPIEATNRERENFVALLKEISW